jgi:RHS repeat-associated protein
MYYVHPDHLGSLMIITDAAGTVKQKCSFDAWGKRTFVTKDPSLIFDRGFTGHEHLDEFGLINMNGRMYDPIVGRFLSPDPFVPDMTYSQDFNRYSYARNNPLKYTDPDGEFIHLIIGAIIGGTINLAANWKNIDGNFWKGVGYFGVGAITGAGSAALGSWVVGATQSAGIITGAMVGAGTGAVTSAVSSVTLNGLNNVVGGQNFWNNWQQNAISGAIGGGISGGIAGGMKGYQLAKDGGKNMWWGGDVKYGRNQWSFFNSEKPYETISWDINNVGSKSLNDCVPTSYAEMNDYFGGSTSYEEYKTITSYQENVGVKTDRGGYERMLGRNFTGDRYDALNLSDPQAARDIVNKGQLVHTNMPYSGIRHVDNLRSIMYYSNKTVLHYRIGSYRLSSVNGNWWFYLFNGIR